VREDVVPTLFGRTLVRGVHEVDEPAQGGQPDHEADERQRVEGLDDPERSTKGDPALDRLVLGKGRAAACVTRSPDQDGAARVRLAVDRCLELREITPRRAD
jgi:hypothetical protein